MEHSHAGRRPKRMMRSRFLCFCVAVLPALAFFGSRPALAATAGAPSAPVPALHWPHFPVHVFVEAKTPDEVQKALVALAGLDEWVDATHGKVCYIRTTDPAKADIAVRFQPGKVLPAGANVIGETAVTWSGTTLQKASIQLVEGLDTLEELQADAAHEFGHALGIEKHSADPDDLMFPVEVLQSSENGDFPPPSAPRVTAHDLRLLAASYPQMLP